MRLNFSTDNLFGTCLGKVVTRSYSLRSDIFLFCMVTSAYVYRPMPMILLNKPLVHEGPPEEGARIHFPLELGNTLLNLFIILVLITMNGY